MTHSDSTPATGTPADAATSRPDDDPTSTSPRDPVTGTTGNTTGEEQAAENEETESVA